MDKEKIDSLIAKFDKKIPQIIEERKGLYELRKEFVEYFNKEKLANMSLEEYCGKGFEDQDSFIGRLCLSLRKLGNVDKQRSNPSFTGVSFSKSGEPILSSTLKKSYEYSSNDSDDEKKEKLEKAFKEKVRADIVSLYRAGEKYDLKAIEDNPRDDWFKAKFLSTYFDEKFLCIFDREDLKKDVQGNNSAASTIKLGLLAFWVGIICHHLRVGNGSDYIESRLSVLFGSIHK